MHDLWIFSGFLKVFGTLISFPLAIQHCCLLAVLPFVLLWLIGALGSQSLTVYPSAPELVANDIHVCFIFFTSRTFPGRFYLSQPFHVEICDDYGLLGASWLLKQKPCVAIARTKVPL